MQYVNTLKPGATKTIYLSQISSQILQSGEKSLEAGEIRKMTVNKSEWSQFFVVSMKKKPPDRSSKLVRWWWWWWITRSSNNRVPKFFNICHKNYDKKMKRDIFSRCSQILSSGTFQIKWKNISFSKIKRYFVTRSCYKISMRYSHKHYLNHKQN